MFIYIAIYIAGAAISRYLREKPMLDGVLSAAVGAAAVILAWLISAVRTLRATLREHGFLNR